MAGEWDDLWTESAAYGRSWWDHTASEQQKAWCETLADQIVKRGQEPLNWKGGVFVKFKEDTEPPYPSETTLRKTVRELVEARG